MQRRPISDGITVHNRTIPRCRTETATWVSLEERNRSLAGSLTE